MKTRPPRRNMGVLWLFVAISISLVLGTVLLGNDMQHLRSLSRRLGVELFPASPAQVTVDRGGYSGARVRISLPPVLGSATQIDERISFSWLRQLEGGALCDQLRASGIPMSDWQETSFNADTFECFFEEVKRDDADVLVGSRFIVVRGMRTGLVTGIRMKLVSPPLDSTGHLDPAIVQQLSVVIDQPHWPDFSDAIDALRRLRDFRIRKAGIEVIFTQEPTRPGAYNLTLSFLDSVGFLARGNRLRILPVGNGPPAIREQGEAALPFLNGWVSHPGRRGAANNPLS